MAFALSLHLLIKVEFFSGGGRKGWQGVWFHYTPSLLYSVNVSAF